MNYRKIVQQNTLGKNLLSLIEKKIEPIRFKKSDKNLWEPNERVIYLLKDAGFLYSQYLGRNWKNRALFHELGHVVLDDFWPKIDQRSFKKIFNGSPNHYPVDELEYQLKRIGTIFSKKIGVTRYAKLDPNEAWAEAFSYVLCHEKHKNLSEAQIRQLAFVDWTLNELLRTSGRRKLKPYQDFKIDSICASCELEFTYGPCRMNLDISGYKLKCPHCGKILKY